MPDRTVAGRSDWIRSDASSLCLDGEKEEHGQNGGPFVDMSALIFSPPDKWAFFGRSADGHEAVQRLSGYGTAGQPLPAARTRGLLAINFSDLVLDGVLHLDRLGACLLWR